jgi:glycosyltransferase involved in cell wall biosynthesis
VAAPSISLVIAVYNKPERLRLVLTACARQSLRTFEVLVADDGSGPDIRTVVAEARRRYTFPTIHLWHNDQGWRKNSMLNNAIRVARAEHIVFIDGDCIPSQHFLLDHWRERAPQTVLLGRRVETSKRWTQTLTPHDVETGRFEHLGWREILDGVRGESLRVEDGVRIPSRFLRKVFLRNVSGMLGSNLSAAKADLEAVNGFDELYNGPGCGEDSDIQFRLSLLHLSFKSLRNLAVQYHLYHPATRVSDECWDRFQRVKELRQPRCQHGLVEL